MNQDKAHSCYVILPVSKTHADRSEDYWIEHFKQFLQPQVEKAYPGMKFHRSNVGYDVKLYEHIPYLIEAEVVIADISVATPSVFWQLAVRQSFKHGTVLVVETGSKLPFDMGRQEIHIYSKDVVENRRFLAEAQFFKAVQERIIDKRIEDSVVLKTVCGRNSLWHTINMRKIQRRLVMLKDEIESNMSVIKDQWTQKSQHAARSVTTDIASITCTTNCLDFALASGYIDDDEFYHKGQNVSLSIRLLNNILFSWNINKDINYLRYIIDELETVLPLLIEDVERIEDEVRKIL